MRKFLPFCLFLFVVVLPGILFSQADDCVTPATTVTLSTSTCTSLAGNTLSATASSGAPACVGTADDDVWYRYTTPAGAANYAFIYVDPASSGFDPVFQALSGACGSQTSQACVNAGAGGQGESIALTGISASTTYYIRIYGYGSGSASDGSFTVCAFNGPKPANDECAAAVNLAQGATCSGTAGTSAWATTSAGIPACVGTADDDVWYKFTTGAGVTYEHIRVVPDVDMDAVVQVFSGACGGLTSIACKNDVGTGGTEDFFVSGLAGSTQYYVRVYHFGNYYGNATNSGTFTICVQGGSPPGNDNCAASTSEPYVIQPAGTCTAESFTTTFATPSGTGTPCTGYSVDDDVWFSFTAINYTHTITVDPNASMNAQIQILSGACGSLLSEQCQDLGGIDGTETMSVTGLTIGNTYYIRVSHNGTYYGTDGSFTICNVATAPVVGDEPCGAFSLPSPTSACIYGTFNLTGSSLTATPGTPGCSWGNKDIWFKVLIPASGNGIIDINGFLVSGGIEDQVMAVYYSNVAGVDNCNSLTLLGCNDDYIGPCGGITQSQFSVSGAANYWIYIRCGLFSGSALNDGKFKLCVTTPTNDECSNPTFVCDMNGFNGTTNQSYGTIFSPFGRTAWEVSMEGWSGGPYGDGGTSIENPSWLQFEASATTATLTLTVSECYCGWGIQFQIMQGGTCGGAVGSWSAKSAWPGTNVYAPGSTVITGTGLTIGATYYCLVDGFAGDLCNYQINGASGVATTVLVTPASQTVNLCSGSTTTLTINPVGSGGTISWSSNPSGFSGSTNSVTVNPVTDPAPDLSPPSGTVTYLATVTGNCITTQTVSATVVVNATPPTPTITTNPVAFCGVTSITATASAPYANDYEWFDVGGAGVPPVGGTSLNTGGSYTPSISDNQIGSYSFYVAAYNNTGNPACTSSVRGTITVPVNTWDGKIKWTGNAPVSTPGWTNTSNWDGCSSSCTDDIGVIIPDQTTVPGPNDWPVISTAVTAKDLQIDANGRLDLTTGGTLNLCGSFGHYGALNILAGSPTITFGGSAKQSYAKISTGTGDLPNIIISNAAGVRVVDGASYKDMELGVGSTLNLTNGVLSTVNDRTVYTKNPASGAVTGFGATSYIDGRLKRAIGVPPLSYDFPVGNSTSYERMKIDFTAGTTIGTATVYFENLTANSDGTGWGALTDAGTTFTTSPAPSPINLGGGGTVSGLWTVIPGAGVANYGMTLYGRNYTNSGTNTHTIIKRETYCPGDWSIQGTYSSSSVSGGTITAARTGMSGFSKFGIGRHSAPLPIELLLFDASCDNDNEVKITWITASEINNDYFTVERSFDNEYNFEPIKTMDGAGTSTNSRQYSFVDESFPGGTCYYRIKQTDFDGNYEYFEAISTSCGRSRQFAVISVLPNPVKDNLFIFYRSDNNSDVVTATITDVLGKIIFYEKMISQEGLNQIKIDMSIYNNGFYYVNVGNGAKNYIEKIVKQY